MARYARVTPAGERLETSRFVRENLPPDWAPDFHLMPKSANEQRAADVAAQAMLGLTQVT